jgi:hypothetical protein
MITNQSIGTLEVEARTIDQLKHAEFEPPKKTEEKIAGWIATNTPKEIKENAPPIISDDKTGKLLRKPASQEELNIISDSITKAKTVSVYLKAALKKPKFDSLKIHGLIAR